MLNLTYLRVTSVNETFNEVSVALPNVSLNGFNLYLLRTKVACSATYYEPHSCVVKCEFELRTVELVYRYLVYGTGIISAMY